MGQVSVTDQVEVLSMAMDGWMDSGDDDEDDACMPD